MDEVVQGVTREWADLAFRSPSVICPLPWRRVIVNSAMTHFPQPNSQHRATRVQLRNRAIALVTFGDGQRAKAKLQTVSVTGGLLQLASALEEGDFVEVAFQTTSGPVHGMAEMLHPRQTANVVVQPFRFVALDDDDHKTLRFMVDTTTDRDFLLGISSKQA